MASALTYADFIAEIPDLSSSETARQTQIQTQLNGAELGVHRATWGSRADLGVIYLAAHNLMLQDRTTKHGGGGAGPVTARTVGPNVVGYGSMITGTPQDVLTSTTYGATFVRLMNQLGLTPLVGS